MSGDQIKIAIGTGDTVVLDKLYGPAVFANLRITADAERGCWVIEREWIPTGEWREVATIEAVQSGELGNDPAEAGQAP